MVFRYFRCPAAVSVAHLQKLIRAKYDLTDKHRVDVMYNQDCLNMYLTLVDVACIYLWRKVSAFLCFFCVSLLIEGCVFAERSFRADLSHLRARP